MTWTPITRQDLENEIAKQLESLDPDEAKFFEAIRAPLQETPIIRFGKVEKAFVVARYKNKVVFYDDIEEGFEITKLNDKGDITECGANQFELKHVINQLRNGD